MSPRSSLLALWAVFLGACNTQAPNPFENTDPTVAPRLDADIVFTGNGYSPRPSGLRELFSVAADGGGVTRLTFCNMGVRRCDAIEAAPAPDRQRMAVRRVLTDTDGDGRLTPADGESLWLVDLARGVQGILVPSTARVSGIDWSPAGDVLVYSAVGQGGVEDLFRADTNGQNNRNLTCPAPPAPQCNAAIRERRPRIDPTGSVAVFERIDPSGKGEIWIYNSLLSQVRVTSGGAGAEPLPETPYMVGSDADPAYSPDGRSVVFRRLTSTGNRGLGTWDILTARTDGSALTVIVSGPAFRGAPDWGPKGIVFGEIDAVSGASSLVVVQPDGLGRRALVTLGTGFDLAFPRWLR